MTDAAPSIRLPDDTQRLTLVGRTGSGKTQAAVWHLSHQNWHEIPWVIYDYKLDELLNEIPNAQRITTDEVPVEPGIYIVNPHPDDIDAVRAQLRAIWEARNMGVFVDEGYMMCSPTSPNPEFRALLTQGRSLHIPVIIASQRPVWLDRFVYSESDFYQVFHLNDKRDRQIIGGYLPEDADLDTRMDDYHSWYYDVTRDDLRKFKPVPGRDVILQTFAERQAALEEKPPPEPTLLFI